MKKVIILLVGILVVIGGIVGITQYYSQSRQSETITKGTLTVGLEGTYAPFSYRENGKLTGYEVDVAQAVGDKLHLKTKFVQTKWDSLIAGLGSNRYDVVMNNVGITPERKKTYRLATPYIYPKTVLIKRSDDQNLTNLESIKGKKMAQSTTSNYGQIARDHGAEIVAVPGIVEAMNLINTNRAEGSLNDLGAFAAWQKQNANADLTTVDISSEVKSQPSGPLLKKDNIKLEKDISKAIEELEKDGTLTKLSMKYFGTDLSHE
ncbi:transporter substrate-binding domain-containing protein [Convivina intestini]|uniref:Amino acid ABC transporter substrate-binding protein (PAAT family) n=1 Tax=Convivina intestini TaxID=1505726 RepID=A0A2U1D7V2_9LACO|nr:transporter substrate-binding domain-containing protein [Convivina intestini]PVY83727.1 amino acid ABC transporter substrate-binding protein (PAAT family) [Convivina intestini]CAH1855054.1 putative amino-acid ABC transporter-binding protein [Convivina intestini]SDB92478.1 cystine transport system substrate-binding protein [Leuconostocaceae bacterium R-53105]